MVQPGLLQLEKAAHTESQIKAEGPNEKPLFQRPGLHQKRKEGDSNLRNFGGYKNRWCLRKLHADGMARVNFIAERSLYVRGVRRPSLAVFAIGRIR